jgi:hypothetical protein
MKKTFLLIVAGLLWISVSFAQQNTDTAKKVTLTQNRPGRTGVGTIVHRDNKHCSTVIREIRTDRKDTVYYLPMGSNLDSLYKEGTRITFKYSRLMIKQPLGCDGMVVHIWDVKEVAKTRKKTTIAK